jgi:hypothetical protein
LQTDAHQHFEVNRRLKNNKSPNKPGISGSGAPAPPSNSTSIQESNSALQNIIASSFKNAVRSVLHEKSRGYKGDFENLAVASAFESAAVGLSKQFNGDSVHTPFLEHHRALIGRPTTVVTLQAGNQFDTRSLSSSRKKHRATNNSLSNDASDLEPRGSRSFPPKPVPTALPVIC